MSETTSVLDLTSVDIDHLEEISSLASLKEWTKTCTACGLRAESYNVTHSSGSFDSPILFVGMNPGFCDDAARTPFTGRAELQASHCPGCTKYSTCFDWQTGQGASRPRVAMCTGFVPSPEPTKVVPTTVKVGPYTLGGVISAGQLLDDMLVALGIDRTKLFITNIALCKTAAGDPKPQYINRCASIRLRTQELLKPKVVVSIGNLATQQYTSKKSPMKYIHGVPLELKDFTLVPTYHPAAILRSMLAMGQASLVERAQIQADISAQKKALYNDFATAFNLLGEAALGPLLLPTKKLLNGRLELLP
jgi:uracil-DNA glycosylase family 4